MRVIHGLNRITLTAEDIPHYERVDTELVDAADRPSSEEYDRYAYLVKVAYENGYCWRCETVPRTTITSISVADTSDIHVVDRLAFLPSFHIHSKIFIYHGYQLI